VVVTKQKFETTDQSKLAKEKHERELDLSNKMYSVVSGIAKNLSITTLCDSLIISNITIRRDLAEILLQVRNNV